MHVVLLPSFYSTPANPVAGSFFREQAHALRALGLQVGVVAVPEKAPWQHPRKPGAWPQGMVWENDDGLPTLRGYHRRMWAGYHWPRLRAWVEWGQKVFEHYVDREGRPDILHVHVADPAGLLGARIKASTGIPVVLTEHASWLAVGSGGPFRDRVAGIAIAAADAGIAVSPALADRLTLRLPLPRGGWRWIPNLVDPSFLATALSDPEPSARDKYCFVSIGNLVPVKGHDVLLRAFAEAFRGDPSTTLRIGGGGPNQRRLRKLARGLGIDDQVRFLGALSREGVRRELCAANSLVLPSRFETFGVVLVEALAVGRPVVATACGGPESIVHEACGLLVSPGNTGMLAQALATMRAESSHFDASSLREDVRARFGADVIGQKIVEVYREVLETQSATSRQTDERRSEQAKK